MEALLESPRAGELIRSIPEEDLYLLVKEVGPEDSLPMLRYASEEQWQYILDLELWHRDRLLPQKTGQWLKLLLQCGWDCVHRWLKSVDPDLLILLMKKEIRVYIREDEEVPIPPEGTGPLWTQDEVYYIAFKNPEHRETIQGILRILAEEEWPLYRSLLEHVYWEVDAEVEEQAYRFRTARLEDHGFLSFEEALAVYRYRSAEEVERIRDALPDREAQRIPEDLTPPYLPLLLALGDDPVGRALEAIQDPEIVQRIKMELAALGNQVLVADGVEMEGKETLLEVLGKIKAYLTIGIQRLGVSRIEEAASLLSNTPLMTLFQAGFSAFLERAWRARRIWREHWSRPVPLRASLLGSPWRELLEGLNRLRPELFDPQLQHYRHPASMEELQHLDQQLERLAAAGDLMQSVMQGLSSDGLREILRQSWHDEEALDWQGVLITSFVQWNLRGSILPEPVSLEEFRRFLSAAWRAKGRRRIKSSSKTGWFRALGERQPHGSLSTEAKRLLDDLLLRLEEELRSVSQHRLDPRFLPFVLIRRTH